MHPLVKGFQEFVVECFVPHCRLMRAFTGREKVLKFVGCYHGHADSFLVQAGSGVATLGLPDSPGVPAASTGEQLLSHKLNRSSHRIESVLKYSQLLISRRL